MKNGQCDLKTWMKGNIPQLLYKAVILYKAEYSKAVKKKVGMELSI